MSMRRRLVFLPCVVGVTLLVGVAFPALFAAEEAKEKALEVGDKAPAWKDLEGTDGKKHSLADLEDAKAVAVAFTCNSCPVAKAYEDRLIALTKAYKDKGLHVVAINVNNVPADRLDRMKERAAEKEFNFDYIYDPSQEIARAYGATVTPHLFLLDKDRKVVYMGAFDNNMVAAEAEEHWFKDAVDAVLAGKKPEVQKTKQFGCGIKYETRAPSAG